MTAFYRILLCVGLEGKKDQDFRLARMNHTKAIITPLLTSTEPGCPRPYVLPIHSVFPPKSEQDLWFSYLLGGLLIYRELSFWFNSRSKYFDGIDHDSMV